MFKLEKLKKSIKMTIMNLLPELQKEILDHIPSKQKSQFSSVSKATLNIVNAVDEIFKEKKIKRNEIQNLKNREILKIIFMLVSCY